MRISTSTNGLWQAALLLVSLVFVVDAQVIDLTSEELYKMSTEGALDLLLDVRSQNEWNGGHIADATHVPNLQVVLGNTDDYEAALKELNLWNCKSCRVAVYCGSGARAGRALTHLVNAGFDGPLYNGQGVGQWTAAGYELVDTPSNEDRPCMNVDPDVLVERQPTDVCLGKMPELKPVVEVTKFQTATEFYDMMMAGEFDIVIDVRTQEEWDAGHIEDAIFIPDLQVKLGATEDYEATLTEVGLWGCRYCRVAVYCRSGRRAGEAIEHLVNAGFSGPLYNGLGVNQWTEEGYDLVVGPSKDDYPCATVEDQASVSMGQDGVCRKQMVLELPYVDFFEDDIRVNNATYYAMIQSELDTNKDLFLAQMDMHNATGYYFNYTRICFCLPEDYPWTVTAELQHLMMGVKPNMTEGMTPAMLVDPVQTAMGDVVQSVVSSAGKELMGPENFQKPISILGLFDRIQDAIDRKAASINVVYNSYWGYPEDIVLDYSLIMADDEFVTVVTGFGVILDSSMEYDFDMDRNSSQIEVEGDLLD